MATWSRRLSAARSRPDLGKPTAPRPEREPLPDTVPVGLDPVDQEALRALLTMARDRPGFETTVEVSVVDSDDPHTLEIAVAYDEDGPTARPVDETYVVEQQESRAGGSGETLLGTMSDSRVVEVLTDTLVISSDLVAIFASVGGEAIWANDAFASAVTARASDRISLTDLLDEVSKGSFEVNVQPALLQYGRWNGRLTLDVDGELLPVSTSLVAHRDASGSVEALSFVARDLREWDEIDARVKVSESRLAALVEHAADIILVVDDEAEVLYASPGAARLLGTAEEKLLGTILFDRIHPEDAELCDFEGLSALSDEDLSVTTEVRLSDATGDWHHVELVVTDLRENPAVEGFVLNARDVTDRVAAVSRLADRAYSDPVTHLPNRMRLIDRLSALLETAAEKSVLVALLDVDRFKAVNESYGHSGGDELLRQIAHRLEDEVGDEALVARLGGNEFAVVIDEVSNVDDALAVCDRVRGGLAEPFLLGDASVEITTSAGIAVLSEGQRPEDLIADADTAVGIAKERGGDDLVILTSDLRARAKRRVHMEHLLRRALDEGDGVTVHYQPIFDLASGRVVSAEALLRVHVDEGELLTPAAFLDAAETTGLIRPLTAQVLNNTCAQLSQWNAEIEPNTPQQISVNVSPKQLDPSFPAAVEQALERNRVAPERLCLEITESMFISQSVEVDQTVQALREIGVRVGLDDFGAGQSSLGYLRRFPLDFVKVDRSLIAGLGNESEDMAIIRATVELAHNLELLVVAVGVETEEQLQFLELLECDRAQGFFYLPALPADEFAKRVAERIG